MVRKFQYASDIKILNNTYEIMSIVQDFDLGIVQKSPIFLIGRKRLGLKKILLPGEKILDYEIIAQRAHQSSAVGHRIAEQLWLEGFPLSWIGSILVFGDFFEDKNGEKLILCLFSKELHFAKVTKHALVPANAYFVCTE